MSKENKKILFEMTENCFDNLEMANALLQLALNNLDHKGPVKIALEKAQILVKNTVETILEIQQKVS